MISWNKQPQLSSAELLSKLLQEAQRVFSKSAELFGDAFCSDGTPCFQLRTPQLEEIRNLEEQKQIPQSGAVVQLHVSTMVDPLILGLGSQNGFALFQNACQRRLGPLLLQETNF